MQSQQREFIELHKPKIDIDLNILLLIAVACLILQITHVITSDSIAWQLINGLTIVAWCILMFCVAVAIVALHITIMVLSRVAASLQLNRTTTIVKYFKSISLSTEHIKPRPLAHFVPMAFSVTMIVAGWNVMGAIVLVGTITLIILAVFTRKIAKRIISSLTDEECKTVTILQQKYNWVLQK